MIEPTDNRNPIDGVRIMIARVMNLARLLAMESSASDDSAAERNPTEKHKDADP